MENWLRIVKPGPTQILGLVVRVFLQVYDSARVKYDHIVNSTI